MSERASDLDEFRGKRRKLEKWTWDLVRGMKEVCIGEVR
jgi:hypothetical protein